MIRLIFFFLILTMLHLPAIATVFNDNFSTFNPQIDTLKCDSSSVRYADTLNRLIKDFDWKKSYIVIDQWKETCSDNEINSRAAILVALSNGVNQSQAIRDYFDNDFHFVFKYRMEYSESDLYEYLSWDYSTYFNYVPLRHQLDSTLMKIASGLKSRQNLTDNERLACQLFSGNERNFKHEVKKKKYAKTFVQMYYKDDSRYLAYQKLGIHLYSGLYSSFDEGQYLGNNLSLGLGLYTPLNTNWQGSFEMRFRILTNDNDFDFIAQNNPYTVNSKIGYNLSANVLYKYFENNHLIVLPKAGLGLESIQTGIDLYDAYNDETKSYDVTTLHANAGLMILTPVFLKNYVGVEISYHYCPYGWSKGLISKFNNHAFSIELNYRF